MKKIAILYNLNRHQHEYETEFDSEETIDKIYDVLIKMYDVVKIEAVKDFSWIKEITKYNPDLVFNICEGFNGPARESVYAAILEQLSINYSGPDSTNLLMCHNKFLVKNLLKDLIKVPFGYVINDIQKISKLRNIKYPVIVKLNSEGSSMGMTEKSVVHNFSELEEQTKILLEQYNRPVLIEEFINGQDISMIYVDGIGALGPCQINCEASFYDYEMKTIKDSSVDIKCLNGDYDRLKKIVDIISKRLDIKGYAKIDFRINGNEFYLIEVNSQVSFHPFGEFITCAKKDGYDFDSIINYIVSNALKNDKKENSTGWRDIND